MWISQRAPLKIAHRDAAAGGEVDLLPVLHDPARRREAGVDPAAGTLLGEFGHGTGAAGERSVSPRESCVPSTEAYEPRNDAATALSSFAHDPPDIRDLPHADPAAPYRQSPAPDHHPQAPRQ